MYFPSYRTVVNSDKTDPVLNLPKQITVNAAIGALVGGVIYAVKKNPAMGVLAASTSTIAGLARPLFNKLLEKEFFGFLKPYQEKAKLASSYATGFVGGLATTQFLSSHLGYNFHATTFVKTTTAQAASAVFQRKVMVPVVVIGTIAGVAYGAASMLKNAGSTPPKDE